MPLKFLHEYLPEFRQPHTAVVLLQPDFDFSELGTQSFATRLQLGCQVSLPRPADVKRKTEKVECTQTFPTIHTLAVEPN